MINRGGITFAYRAGEETGATPEQVARAYVVCREIFDLAGFVRGVEATDNVVTTTAQTALYLEFRRLIDRSVRWFLTSRPAVLDIAAEVARFRPGIEAYAARMPEVLQGTESTRLRTRTRELEAKGVPEVLAQQAASLLDVYSLLDCVEIAEDTGEELDDVVGVYFLTSEAFSIDAMLSRVTMLPREDRWDAMARGALRDDLYAVLESLARSVLEVSRPRRRRAGADGAVVRAQRRRTGPGSHRARGDRADVARRHRRALGRVADAPDRDEAGILECFRRGRRTGGERHRDEESHDGEGGTEEGCTEEGHDEEGPDEEGHDEKGPDEKGHDEEGHDDEGRDQEDGGEGGDPGDEEGAGEEERGPPVGPGWVRRRPRPLGSRRGDSQ